MKQAIIKQYGDTNQIQIIETQIPKPSKNELLVNVMAAALNPKDILVRKGKFKQMTGKKFPQGIGYDFAGIVEDVNGTSFKKGDKIFGMLNGMKGRSCAEYLAISENEVYQMPENLSFEEAAGTPLVGQTSLQAIRNLGKLKAGQKICINGASGGVGTMALQIAKDFGGMVTSISSHRNLDFCKSLRADIALDYNESNILKIAEKFDVFYDVFGNYSFKNIAPILSKSGIYVSTVPKPEILMEQYFWNLFRSKKGKLVVVKSNAKDLKYLHDKILEGKIKPVIDKVYPMELMAEAQKYIETKRAKGKVIIKVG